MTVAEIYRMIENLDLADAKRHEGALILATDGYKTRSSVGRY